MISTQIQNNTKYIEQIPFIEYNNNKFSFKQDKKFIYTKNYNKGQSSLTSRFITDFEKEWKKYIELLSAYAMMEVKDNNTNQIITDMKKYLNEFISSYNNNKNIIDKKKFLNGGKTTLEIEYIFVLIVNEKIETRENKSGIETIKNKYFAINYKLKKIRLSNERW